MANSKDTSPQPDKDFSVVMHFRVNVRADPDRWSGLEAWLEERELIARWSKSRIPFRGASFRLEVEEVAGDKVEELVDRFEPDHFVSIELLGWG